MNFDTHTTWLHSIVDISVERSLWAASTSIAAPGFHFCRPGGYMCDFWLATLLELFAAQFASAETVKFATKFYFFFANTKRCW